MLCSFQFVPPNAIQAFTDYILGWKQEGLTKTPRRMR
jgi:hypothetical protein